jgi:hypothetical protein
VVIALFDIHADAEWLAAAGNYNKVALIYGTSIGVRRPSDVPESRYDDDARAAELDRSRNQGTVTGETDLDCLDTDFWYGWFG